ncbi:MAG TPA: hypothetical protein VFQ61_38460 [Polyangiaceae bacterium]|nr:hypothetical protein [Polyangiaceae bacterium]
MQAPVRLRIASLALLGSACFGCGTSGQNWVLEPPEAFSSFERSARLSTGESPLLDPLPAQTAPSTAGSEPQRTKPRLSRVISLGESQSSAISAGPPRDSRNDGSPAFIIVNNYVGRPGSAPHAAGGVYSSSVYSAPFTGRNSSATTPGTHVLPSRSFDARTHESRPTPNLGQDWSPPPNYGPLFPYKSSPAPVWGRR